MAAHAATIPYLWERREYRQDRWMGFYQTGGTRLPGSRDAIYDAAIRVGIVVRVEADRLELGGQPLRGGAMRSSEASSVSGVPR